MRRYSGWRERRASSRCSRPARLCWQRGNSVPWIVREWRGDSQPAYSISAAVRYFIVASQRGRLDAAVVISSLYPAITVLLARIFLHEHFSRWRIVGMIAALVAVPMIAG